ncbi:NAD-dependent epimerase/dehydratase family protein [Micromonospora sp. NPDC048935]|uniref:NAD-dependent epimerase/dehydratase family protein n=1 Tax=Micromonospora sp. NPDC048935 TaxID=3364262 RepID=UPI003720402D
MTVLVTGGTGFVGTHVVAALLRAGHRVRVLARPGRQPELPGVEEFVVGDVTDAATVARAVRGVEYVLHAASVYSFDSRRRAETRRVNARGTAVVLEAARRAGVACTVHVSTFGALLPAPGRVVGPDSPVGAARETYLASKAEAERIARWHQRDGSPVVIVYPPALLGPDDPRLGDQTGRLRAVLRGFMPIWPTGGFPIGDVRDTAALLAGLLTSEGSGRVFGPGRYVSTRDYVRTVREVTGRSLPTLFLPARAMLPAAAMTDVLQRVWPWHIPAEYGACYVCACDSRVDPLPAALGIEPRPFADTLADTVRWLHRAGLVSSRQVGTLAAPVPVA